MESRICQTCTKRFEVPKFRATTAKYCSTACRDTGAQKAPNFTCGECGTPFYMKPSQVARYPRTLGVFCSHTCTGAAKKRAYAGEKNPNYKGRNFDHDGYRLYSPQSSWLNGLKRMKLHQAICCEVLGIEQIPKGLHVHHRDCDILHNTAENLAVLTISDHKWLHKQFGVAVLWAFRQNKISLETLVSWSDNQARAQRLLPLSVLQQTAQSLGLVPDEHPSPSQETAPCSSPSEVRD